MYASEARNSFPRSVTSITLELKIAIPKGYYGKTFPPSGLLRDHFITCDSITCDSGVIDSGYRGTVAVLLINQSLEHYTVRVGKRIVQMVLMKKCNVDFEQVSNANLLGTTEWYIGGFRSTGMTSLESLIKKKNSEEILVIAD